LPAVRPLSATGREGGKDRAQLCTPVSAVGFADTIGSDLNAINEFFKCHCSRYRSEAESNPSSHRKHFLSVPQCYGGSLISDDVTLRKTMGFETNWNKVRV
ncbi:hypothetical protein DV515_00007067, partial [Chloebia gouldiae]